MDVKLVRSVSATLLQAALSVVGISWAQAGPSAVPPESAYRPLQEAARLIENRYAVAVTYEDPTLLRRDDMRLIGTDENLPRAFVPSPGLLALPARLTPELTPKLTAKALQEVIDLFHQLNPQGPTFRLTETRYGFHIVPDSVRDENGGRVASPPILGVHITVPEALRTAAGHLAALADAVSKTSGVKMILNDEYVDQFYALNGYVPDKNADLFGTDEEQRRFSFTWGIATATPARDALISLLENSATTITWQFRCTPNAKPENRECVMNLSPIQVAVTGEDGQPTKKLLLFDRCAKCPPLPPAPPPAPQR
jgi:hypothetical protein